MASSWMKDFKERMAFWWELHDGLEGIWDDLVSPLRWKWESFKMWRRKRNPELVELDAYRELVGIEKRLQEWPRATPLLEDALRNYEITGQDDKVRDIVRRLREADPQSKCLEAIEKKPKKDVSPEIEELAMRAMELVRSGERASVSNFQRKLGIGYNQAEQIWTLLEERASREGQTLVIWSM